MICKYLLYVICWYHCWLFWKDETWDEGIIKQIKLSVQHLILIWMMVNSIKIPIKMLTNHYEILSYNLDFQYNSCWNDDETNELSLETEITISCWPPKLIYIFIIVDNRIEYPLNWLTTVIDSLFSNWLQEYWYWYPNFNLNW